MAKTSLRSLIDDSKFVNKLSLDNPTRRRATARPRHRARVQASRSKPMQRAQPRARNCRPRRLRVRQAAPQRPPPAAPQVRPQTSTAPVAKSTASAAATAPASSAATTTTKSAAPAASVTAPKAAGNAVPLASSTPTAGHNDGGAVRKRHGSYGDGQRWSSHEYWFGHEQRDGRYAIGKYRNFRRCSRVPRSRGVRGPTRRVRRRQGRQRAREQAQKGRIPRQYAEPRIDLARHALARSSRRLSDARRRRGRSTQSSRREGQDGIVAPAK